MSKCSFFAGMAAGMVAGAGVCLLIKPMDEADKKRLKKNTSRVFTAVGAVADQLLDMYR